MSEDTKTKIRVAEPLVRNASSFVSSLGCNDNSATTSLLSGLTAVLAPQPHPYANDLVPAREFSKVLGLNRNAKYFHAGPDNRE